MISEDLEIVPLVHGLGTGSLLDGLIAQRKSVSIFESDRWDGPVWVVQSAQFFGRKFVTDSNDIIAEHAGTEGVIVMVVAVDEVLNRLVSNFADRIL